MMLEVAFFAALRASIPVVDNLTLPSSSQTKPWFLTEKSTGMGLVVVDGGGPSLFTCGWS